MEQHGSNGELQMFFSVHTFSALKEPTERQPLRNSPGRKSQVDFLLKKTETELLRTREQSKVHGTPKSHQNNNQVRPSLSWAKPCLWTLKENTLTLALDSFSSFDAQSQMLVQSIRQTSGGDVKLLSFLYKKIKDKFPRRVNVSI